MPYAAGQLKVLGAVPRGQVGRLAAHVVLVRVVLRMLVTVPVYVVKVDVALRPTAMIDVLTIVFVKIVRVSVRVPGKVVLVAVTVRVYSVATDVEVAAFSPH